MRRTLGTLLCLAVATVGLQTVNAPGAAGSGVIWTLGASEGTVTIRADRPGSRVEYWGYDLKQTCGSWKPRSCRKYTPVNRMNREPDYVQAIFGSGHMNMVRIPLRADQKGVKPNGLVRKSFYARHIGAIRKAMRAHHGKDLLVFASRNTVNDCPRATENRPVRCLDYAPALKTGGRASGQVVPAKYARLVHSYLRHFRRHGIRVDVLGLENEPANNEGRLVRGDKFARVAGALKRRAGPGTPRLAMSCTGDPRPVWFRQIGDARGKRDTWSKLSIASTHYSSRKRKKTRHRLRQLAAVANGQQIQRRRPPLPAWDTEFHWNDLARTGPWGDAREAMYSIFDHTDFGYQGIVWWAFSPRKKSRMQQAVVRSTSQAASLPVPGRAGPAQRGRLTMRAFGRNGVVHLWVINDTRSSVDRQALHLEGARRAGRPTYTRWTEGRRGQLVRTTGSAASTLLGDPRLTFPAKSITLVRVPVR